MTFILKVFNKLVVEQDGVVCVPWVRAVGQAHRALVQHTLCNTLVNKREYPTHNAKKKTRFTWHFSYQLTKWSGHFSLMSERMPHCFRPLGALQQGMCDKPKVGADRLIHVTGGRLRQQ